jgi:internalin A
MRDYPNVTFRVYGHYGMDCDLEFLRHFGSLRRFQVDVFDLKDLSPISYLPNDLESLGIGAARKRSHSLRLLERFVSLKKLFLEGHTKDIEVIGQLKAIEDLTLRSITLPNLAILKPLRQLRSLDLKLGGTKDLTLLPQIGKLRYLELWMVKGLTDLEPIADVHTLQYVFLQALKRVTRLPSLRELRLVRRVHIETMKGLSDLKAVADAPNLEELLVVDMRHLTVDSFRPFVRHPTLRRVIVGLGSIRRNKAVTELLGLPQVERAKGGFAFI